MGFTYTNPTFSEVDAVRFLLGDTNERQALLQDEEIQWVIDTWQGKNSLYFYASVCAEAVAAKLAREVSLSADGQSLSLSELQEKYTRLAHSLRAQHQELLASGVGIHAGGMSAGEQRDPTLLPLAFGTQMHDNPEAGWQDYGDRGALPEFGQWGEFTP